MKKITVLVLSFLVVLTLSACGGSEVDVGIVLPTDNEPRWVQDEGRFEELLEDTDYSVEILFSDGDSNTERENVESLIQKGVDVLIITAHDAGAAGAAVEDAKEEGITVIAYDRLITDTDAVDYYVTFDSVAVGEAQGQYLIDQAEGSGNPLYLYSGATSDNNAFLFFEGAWNVLQPKIDDGTFDIINSSNARDLQDTQDLSRSEMNDIMGQINTQWDFEEAISLAESDLTSASADDGEKDEVFILAPNDGTARNIGDTFDGDDDITDYHITGQDAESESIQYIIDGGQSMTVFKDTRTLTDMAYDMAINVLEGEDVETTRDYDNGEIEVPASEAEIVTVTKDNVKEEIFDSGYYDIDEFDNTDSLD